MKFTYLAAVSWMGCMIAGASAASIGFNTGSTFGTVAGNAQAGVVPQANWNNASTTNDSAQTINSLLGDNGSVVAGVSATFRASKGNGEWRQSLAFTGANADLIFGYLDEGWDYGNSSNQYVTFSGLAGAYANGYDVYVYVNGDQGSASTGSTVEFPGGAGVVTLNPSYDPGNGNQLANPSSINLGTINRNASTFVQATGSNSGNYVKYSNVTGSSFTVSHFGFGSGISAVQIVAPVPEPTTLGLLAGGSMLMLIRRRK